MRRGTLSSTACKCRCSRSSSAFRVRAAGFTCWTARKGSALSLVAQARKYGLGMMFATQAPKGLDNKIVLNCTTQFYGKMGSETDARTVKQLIHDKGGAAEDIGKLPRGEFYFSTEGSLRPFK